MCVRERERAFVMHTHMNWFSDVLLFLARKKNKWLRSRHFFCVVRPCDAFHYIRNRAMIKNYYNSLPIYYIKLMHCYNVCHP